MTYKNSSLYIVSITLLSMILFMVGIFFIDRIVNFIPPISGKFYDIINLTNISIVLIMILIIVRAGYLERTAIVLTRFDVLFNRMLSSIGIKNPPVFDTLNNENNEFTYQVAFDKAKDAAIASGASNEKAIEIGHTIVDKLKKIKSVQQTTDEQQILNLTNSSSSSSNTSLGTSGSGQNMNNGLLTMQGQNSTSISSSFSSQNSTQNIPMSSITTTNPYSKKNEAMTMGMDMGMGMNDEPEPANGALGGNFTSW